MFQFNRRFLHFHKPDTNIHIPERAVPWFVGLRAKRLFSRYWEQAQYEIFVSHSYAFCEGGVAYRSRASCVCPWHDVLGVRSDEHNRHELQNACVYCDVADSIMRGKRSAGEGLLSDNWILITDRFSRWTTLDVIL